MALVLCTGVDQTLIQTRKLVLENAGHSVVTATNELELVSACQRHVFDVAVIGQAISPQEKRQLFALVRQHSPSAVILELYQSHLGRVLNGADDWLVVPADVPQHLPERVSALAARHSHG